LALQSGDSPVMMQSIAENQAISRKYLDTIFGSLKSVGLIRSKRGIGGGHMLVKDPDDILLSDVIQALEGPFSLVDCVFAPATCSRSKLCVTRDVWHDVGQAMLDVLDNITVGDLVRKHYKSHPGSPKSIKTNGICEVD